MPLLIAEQAIGYFGMIPGAILGGLAYRFSSASYLPDRATRVRRWIYTSFAMTTIVIGALSAMAITTYAPAMGGQVLGISARGFTFALYLCVLTGPFALGMALSGDRRADAGVTMS